MKRDVTVRRVYPYPLDAVWQAFVTSDALAQWLMPNTFEPRLGHRFEFRTRPAPGFDGIVRCEVLALDPPHRLSFSWVGGGIDTRVTFQLRAEAGGTSVTLTHTGFAGPKGVLLSYMLGNGWAGMLDRKLPRVIAKSSAGPSAVTADVCEGDTTRFWRVFNRAFRRFAAVLLVGWVSLASGRAEQSAPAPVASVKAMVINMYAPIAENLLAAAAMMPEDKYEYRSSPDVRSFGQMIAHVGGSQFLYCSTAAGTRLDPAVFTRLGQFRPYADGAAKRSSTLTMKPSELVALLRDGVEYCRTVQNAVSEGALFETVTFGGRPMPRLQAFLENVAHNNEHYGNLVAYLRLNGLVPPSSRPPA
jgi:uncharacterized protein YndB with AHSA1/START domain